MSIWNEIFRVKFFVLGILFIYTNVVKGQADSLSRCVEHLDKAQRFFLENKLIDSERSALLGWELSQKIGHEELMSRD